MTAVHRTAGRLPQYGVTHQRRRSRQVACNRRKIERRNRKHKTFQRPVIDIIPHARLGAWLFTVNLLQVMRVVSEKIDQLAGGVNLRLEDSFALPQHCGAVECITVGSRQKVGCLEKNRRPRLPGHTAPVCMSVAGGFDGLANLFGTGLMVVTQQMTVVVRRLAVAHPPGSYLFTPDAQRNLDLGAHHRFKRGRQCRPLGTSRRVAAHRFVDRNRNAGSRISHGQPLTVWIPGHIHAGSMLAWKPAF